MNRMVIEGVYSRMVEYIVIVTTAGACLAFRYWFGTLPARDTPVTGWLSFGSSVLGVVLGVLYAMRFAFRKWMWRWKLLRERVVRFPDLSGTWLAHWESVSFRDKFCSVVTIRHDFDRIVFTSRRRRPDGAVIHDGIGVSCQLQHNEATARTQLYVVYRSRPGKQSDRAPGGWDHEGCARLELIDGERQAKDWILRGDYWTNKPWQPDRKPGDGGTRGHLHMEWVAELRAFDENPALRARLLEQTEGEEPLDSLPLQV